MLKHLLFCIILFGTHFLAAQTSTFVSNRYDGIHVDYIDLQEAIDNASSGDTIYVYPSGTNYGSITIDKPVYLIGMGYDLHESVQPSLEITSEQYGSSVKNVTITKGGSGGRIESIEGLFFSMDSLTSFAIGRCKIDKCEISSSTNLTITGCYFEGQFYTSYKSSPYHTAQGGTRMIVYIKQSTSILFRNNIIDKVSSRLCAIVSDNVSNGIFVNNYFGDEQSDRSSYFFNSTLNNNIFNFSVNGTNNTTDKNYTCSNQNCSGVFSNTDSFDTNFRLDENSPAIGAGVDGVDCGPYGGSDPYRPSGIYNRPLIYQINMPVEIQGNSLDVNIKVRNHE